MNSLFGDLGIETPKKVKIEDGHVIVLDKSIQKKIQSLRLSPSTVDAILSSPGDWIMGKFIEQDCIDTYTDALLRGSWFHAIMENFFAKPAETRDYEELKKSIKEVSDQDDYKILLEREDNKDWLRKAIGNYKKVWLPNAKNEKIANIFIMGKNQKGIELFVQGKIGNTNHNTLGFIDKIIEGETGLIILDWKTGAEIHNFDPTKKPSADNPFGYWRQQTAYAMLLEQYGLKVESTGLIFPMPDIPQIVDVPFNDPKVRQMVIDDFEKADKIVDECIENGFKFPFIKGKWNGWASYCCGIGNARHPKVNEAKFDELVDM